MPAPAALRQASVWTTIIALLAITSWFSWKALRDAKPDVGGGSGISRPPSTVIVRPIEEKPVVDTLRVTGTLRAARRAEIAARESAALLTLEVDEGDLIKEGDLIATLDPRRLDALLVETEAALTSAEAELVQRAAELERNKLDYAMMVSLWDEKAVSEREYLDSQRELKVSEARLLVAREGIEAAKKRRDLISVRRGDLDVVAPFDGRVVSLHAELGEWLAEGSPVVTLLSTGDAEAWLQVPERHAALLRETVPESVEIQVTGLEDPCHADKLRVIPDIEGQSRLFTLIVHIPDPENRLTPGTSVSASVPLGVPTPKLVTSSDAVLKSHAGHYVYVPDRDADGPPTAKQVKVDLLFERSGNAVLAPGPLKVGDEVIVEGNERLFPGTPLAPSAWSETRASK
jgi:multidrug efflux system membrane fusion protein